MQKKPRGYFEIENQEYSSSEFVFTALSILESRGYTGFFELMSIIKDPALIIQILRLFYGMEIKVPPLDEFRKCLLASEYIYCDMHKHINSTLPAKPKDIRQFMGITPEEEQELLQIFDEWVVFMNKEGHDIRNYLHCNRNNTKKRIDMAVKGKKWTSTKY